MKPFWIVLLLFSQQLIAQDTSYDNRYTSYKKQANTSKANNNYPQALDYFDRALSLAQQKNDESRIVSTYKDIGVALQEESKYPAAQDNFFKALSISEKSKEHPYIRLIYADIASTYTIENQIAKAKEYAQKALNVNDKSDTIALTKALETMGVVYKQTYEAQKFEKKVIDTSVLDSARYYYIRALNVYQAARNAVGQASMLMQIGSTYEDSYNNDRRSLDYYLQSKAIWDKTDPTNKYALYNLANLANNYYALAVTLDTMPYIKDRRPLQRSWAQKGETIFNEALSLSGKSANNVVSLYALDNISQLQAFEGNFKEAYRNMRKYSQMHDSTFSQENADKMVSLEAQHEVDIRDRQIQISRLEIANRRRLTLFLTIGLFFVLALGTYIYIQNRNRKRTNAHLADLNKQLAHANKINTQFFSILHHDIRRPIASVITLLNLQKKDPALLNEQNKDQYFTRITRSAENLLATMEDLLLWSKGQMENFKPQFTDVAIKDLFDFIRTLFDGAGVEISFDQDPDGMELYTDGDFLKTIMLNLTNNAVHALAHTTEPQILWKAWQDEHYNYLAISDNGPGATNEQLKALYDDTVPAGIKHGLGLHIVRDMAKAIDCKIEINTRVQKGVEIRVAIKRMSFI